MMNEPARLSRIDERLFPSLASLTGQALVGVLIRKKRSSYKELPNRRVSPRFQMQIGEVIYHYEDSDLLVVQYQDGSREVLKEGEVKKLSLPGDAYVLMGYDKPSLRLKRASSSSTEASDHPSESPLKPILSDSPVSPRVTFLRNLPMLIEPLCTEKPAIDHRRSSASSVRTARSTSRPRRDEASGPSKKRRTLGSTIDLLKSRYQSSKGLSPSSKQPYHDPVDVCLSSAPIRTPSRMKASPATTPASPTDSETTCEPSPEHYYCANEEVQMFRQSGINSLDEGIIELSEGHHVLSNIGAIKCYYNPILIKHVGVGPDTAARWMRHCIISLRRSINTGDLYLVSQPSKRVSLKDIAATGVHSDIYLNGLASIDKWLKAKSHELKKDVLIDLCSDACREIVRKSTGRNSGVALSSNECVMDRNTLDVCLCSCSMMNDALNDLLSQRAYYDGGRSERFPQSAIVFGRASGHQVPVFLGPEDERVISEHLRCEGCDRSTNEKSLLVCDNDACQRGYHIGCLTPPLPVESLKDPTFKSKRWFCPHCTGTLTRDTCNESDSESDSEVEVEVSKVDLIKRGGPMNIKPGEEIACGGHFINSIAFAINNARAARKVSKVAILDISLLHGCGNESAFYHDPNVLTMSIHRYGENIRGETILPGTGSCTRLGEKCALGRNVNLEIPAGWGNPEYFASIKNIFVPVLRQFQPEVIILVTSFDGLDSSKSEDCYINADADCKLTPSFYEWLPLTLRKSLPHALLIASIEGGYDPLQTSESVRSLATGLRRMTEKARMLELEKSNSLTKAAMDVWRTHVSPQVGLYRSTGWRIGNLSD